ncbi:NYN domain-containing protein [Falsigemmobacter faecalis]|uniref:RNase NYN domain-containing protein n=1 Tax=Falsigemmobacter faecalis TaxID=2488730 RepID=A0A3P3DKD0_9RHOB|nr:hypothetical protein [Falsigemmobacter faecalis]RRH74719.1 hypothetical protein EG244_09440 [Falsigemmobacter faecalis]
MPALTDIFALLEANGIGAWLILFALLGIILKRLWPAPGKPILVDGSNVLHWANNNPDLRALRRVITLLQQSGYRPEVVFDANVGWLVFDRWSGPEMLAPHIGVQPRDITVVGKGKIADLELLERAKRRKLRIVTNDGYRDWILKYPMLRRGDVLVRGRVGLTGAELDLANARSAGRDARR